MFRTKYNSEVQALLSLVNPILHRLFDQRNLKGRGL